MKMRINACHGVTIIEILIASLVFVIMSGGVWTIMRSTTQVAGISQAKDEAKGMAEIILKHLQQDVAVSKADIDKKNLVKGLPTVKTSFTAGGGQISMKIPKPGVTAKMDDDYVDVVYSLNGKELFREDGNTGNKRLLSSNVSKLEAFVLSDSQVSIEIEIEVLPPGAQTPVTHKQQVLVTIREALADAVDSRWLTSDEVSDY